MFWLEESGETPLGIVRAAAVLLPCEKELERKRKESKSIHFPVTSLECLGRGGLRGAWV